MSTSFLNNCDEVCWDKGRKLNWEDFQGTVSNTGQYQDSHAVTNARIEYNGFTTNNGVVYLVFNKFIKSKSWTRSDTSRALLRHEQLHFDIAEIYTRKIRKSIDSLRKLKIPDKTIYNNKIHDNLESRRKFGALYDTETYHGVHRKKQQEWELHVCELLKELEKYSSSSEDCNCDEDFE